MNQITDLHSEIDLDDFQDVETGVLVLTNPATGEPSKSTITLASPEHPSRKKIDMARTRKLRAAFHSTGKLPVNDPTEDVEEETELLVAVTVGWNLMQGGQPLPFTADNVRKLYTDPKRKWVRTQVMASLGKSDLFINTSAKS